MEKTNLFFVHKKAFSLKVKFQWDSIFFKHKVPAKVSPNAEIHRQTPWSSCGQEPEKEQHLAEVRWVKVEQCLSRNIVDLGLKQKGNLPLNIYFKNQCIVYWGIFGIPMGTKSRSPDKKNYQKTKLRGRALPCWIM